MTKENEVFDLAQFKNNSNLDRIIQDKFGFYCVVNGKAFGPWPFRKYAEAGLVVEQRRALKKTSNGVL